VAPDAVLSSVTLDLNDDAAFDRAVLVQGGAEADLYIYLSQPSGSDRRELALLKKDAAWAGNMWATLPSLEVSPKGSLLLKSLNDSIGRNRWEQTLTIVYRDGKLVVAGITYKSRDTLDRSASLICDVNLLTGQGTRNGKKVTLPGKAVPLADWSDDSLPKACR
jgi:hypothetical protein